MAGKDRRANGSAPDDAEFEKLLDEMDELGRQADALRAKVNHLIDEMRENDVPADEEADGVAEDDAAGDGAVNGHGIAKDDAASDAAGEADVASNTNNVTESAANEDANDKPDAS